MANQNPNQSTKYPAPSEAGTASKPTTGDHGVAHAQEVMDEDTEKGYHGSVPDETPNENYTVAGQLAGKSTPESLPAEKGKEA